MSYASEFFKRLFSKQFWKVDHTCPYCHIEMDCYGSEPWGLWGYKCEKCGYKDDPHNLTE